MCHHMFQQLSQQRLQQYAQRGLSVNYIVMRVSITHSVSTMHALLCWHVLPPSCTSCKPFAIATLPMPLAFRAPGYPSLTRAYPVVVPPTMELGRGRSRSRTPPPGGTSHGSSVGHADVPCIGPVHTAAVMPNPSTEFLKAEADYAMFTCLDEERRWSCFVAKLLDAWHHACREARHDQELWDQSCVSCEGAHHRATIEHTRSLGEAEAAACFREDALFRNARNICRAGWSSRATAVLDRVS